MKQGKLIQGKILVRQDDAETVLKSGIIIPDTTAEKPKRGTIVVVGPSSERAETLCEVGDKIYFKEHVGTEIELNDPEIGLEGTFLLMNYLDVLIFKQ